ncbi:MAG TPA: orotate phosphoribosyltransferase [Rubricoccaceae bacterium]|jgi:orotate phosphoribosyltransferase
MSDAAAVARDLLRIGAVALRPTAPFTWASGRLSPVYTDNRLALSFPDVRSRIADGLAALARPLAAESIAGTATAGIPHAALVADRLELPLCYVRASAKDHGRQNRIEGRIFPGQRAVLVEDLVSTGGSVLSAADALREAGAVPVAALAVFSYGFAEADAAFGAAGLPLHTLTTFDALVGAARADGSLSEADLATLADWHRDASGWSRARGGA